MPSRRTAGTDGGPRAIKRMCRAFSPRSSVACFVVAYASVLIVFIRRQLRVGWPGGRDPPGAGTENSDGLALVSEHGRPAASDDAPPGAQWRFRCPGRRSGPRCRVTRSRSRWRLFQQRAAAQAFAHIQTLHGGQPLNGQYAAGIFPPSPTGDGRRPGPSRRGLPGWRRLADCPRCAGATALCSRWPAPPPSPGQS